MEGVPGADFDDPPTHGSGDLDPAREAPSDDRQLRLANVRVLASDSDMHQGQWCCASGRPLTDGASGNRNEVAEDDLSGPWQQDDDLLGGR